MLQFDPLYYPHKSQRTMVFAQNGMVATSQPLAAEAGLSVLRQGEMPSMRRSNGSYSRYSNLPPTASVEMLLLWFGPAESSTA